MKRKPITTEEFFSSELPGVTTVLSNVFGEDEFKEIPEAVLKAATERGHKVHEYIEHFINNKEWPEIELAYQTYIDSFIEWYEMYKPEFVFSEKKLLNRKDGYKGIIDTLFYYNDKGKKILCMCDWKTSSNLNRFKTMCQLNLYVKMFKENYPVLFDIDEIRTLSITKDSWRFSKFPIDKKLTNSILYLYNEKKKWK